MRRSLLDDFCKSCSNSPAKREGSGAATVLCVNGGLREKVTHEREMRHRQFKRGTRAAPTLSEFRMPRMPSPLSPYGALFIGSVSALLFAFAIWSFSVDDLDVGATLELTFNRLMDAAIAAINFANMLGLMGALFSVGTLLMRTIVPLLLGESGISRIGISPKQLNSRTMSDV